MRMYIIYQSDPMYRRALNIVNYAKLLFLFFFLFHKGEALDVPSAATDH